MILFYVDFTSELFAKLPTNMQTQAYPTGELRSCILLQLSEDLE
jgi:hypothetical protein